MCQKGVAMSDLVKSSPPPTDWLHLGQAGYREEGQVVL